MMNISGKSGFILIFSSAIFLLFACDGNQPFKDIKSYIHQLKEAKVSTIVDGKPLVKEIKPPKEVIFKEKTRRSPFDVIDAGPAKVGTLTNPLQAYPLDMLRFVGTVTKDGVTVAFIAAPDNKIYRVKVGDVLGDRDSKVLSIDSDRMSLMEEKADDSSATIKQVMTLQLKEASP